MPTCVDSESAETFGTDSLAKAAQGTDQRSWILGSIGCPDGAFEGPKGLPAKDYPQAPQGYEPKALRAGDRVQVALTLDGGFHLRLNGKPAIARRWMGRVHYHTSTMEQMMDDAHWTRTRPDGAFAVTPPASAEARVFGIAHPCHNAKAVRAVASA